MEKRYLDLKEASRYTGSPVNTLYSWTSQRRIPFIKKGGRLRFDRIELDEWMANDARPVIEEPEYPRLLGDGMKGA